MTHHPEQCLRRQSPRKVRQREARPGLRDRTEVHIRLPARAKEAEAMAGGRIRVAILTPSLRALYRLERKEIGHESVPTYLASSPGKQSGATHLHSA